MEFRIVPSAEAGDPALRAELLDLWVAVTDAGGSVGFVAPAPAGQIADTLDSALARVAAGADALGILDDGGSAVGMGFLVDRGNPLQRHWRTVLRLMVHPKHQGQGAGRLLLEGLHEHAAGLGLEQLQLSIRGGEGLAPFYQRFGYRIIGSHPGAVRVAPGDDRDELFLVTRL